MYCIIHVTFVYNLRKFCFQIRSSIKVGNRFLWRLEALCWNLCCLFLFSENPQTDCYPRHLRRDNLINVCSNRFLLCFVEENPTHIQILWICIENALYHFWVLILLCSELSLPSDLLVCLAHSSASRRASLFSLIRRKSYSYLQHLQHIYDIRIQAFHSDIADKKIGGTVCIFSVKRQSHEIFDLWFFHE